MRIARSLLVSCSVVLFVGCSSGRESTDTTSEADKTARRHAPVCPGPSAPGTVRCHAHVIVDETGAPAATSGPTGYNPGDLQAAYALPSSTGGAGQVIAVVDAFDYPSAESDLGVYRAKFGLAPCTTSNGCFRKVNQDGVAGSYPHSDTGWSQEAALDLDMASAVCPNCKLVLVEATSNSFADLAASVDTAVRLGATVVSNSYGGSEWSAETSVEEHFAHPGVAITVSSGDSGYGASFPAASRYVTAVGGTSLRRATNTRGFSETVWSGAGSGCSAYVSKPSWQHDADCSRRAIADVAAVADPYTGVSVYWTGRRRGGWMVFGGTSVGAPLIAGVFALAANSSSITAGYPYAHPTSLFDVTSGSNGSCGDYLCTGATGYDGPTGLGTPNAVGAF
ncbi:MAG: S53 family peptidase [Polyangiales bacterium]